MAAGQDYCFCDAAEGQLLENNIPPFQDQHRESCNGIVLDLDGTLYDLRRLRAMIFVRLVQAAFWRRSIALSSTIPILSAYRHALERMRTDGTAVNDNAQIRIA